MGIPIKVWAVLSALLLAFPTLAQAQKVALVVANSDYEHTSQLANPSRDATLVAGALREAGFDTIELAENLSNAQFNTALRDFARKADGADAALVYFAGHGIESAGRNWLLPVDVALEAEKDLPYEAMELQRVLDTLDGAKLRIAVLDACRNNPFANRWESENRSVARGLAPLEVDDMLVIYAAAPGAFAFDGADGNSPFALALARRLVQPGLPVQLLGGMVRDDVLNATEGEQRPFISASMTGRPLFLVQGPDAQADWLVNLYAEEDSTALALTDDTVRGVQPAEPGALRDDAIWLEALQADTVRAYRAYLEQFSDGMYAPFAQANIAQLLDPTATGGELDTDKPWIISLGAALPSRYGVDLGAVLPIDGVWRISANNKRLRIERGRAFAVDGWNHALVFRVAPEQVTITNIRREEPGVFVARDILLLGDMRMQLREDGNLDVRVGTFPFPTKYVLIREAIDDPDALAQEMPR